MECCEHCNYHKDGYCTIKEDDIKHCQDQYEDWQIKQWEINNER